MLEKLGNGAKIAELQGVPGASATRERGKGFENAVKGKLDITAKQTASFDRAKGLTVTENILQGNPEIKGLFSQNDEMALGAAQAAKSANKDLMIVGFDGEADGLKAVKNGEMAATVAQQPEEMGRLAVKAAYDHFNGKKVKAKIDSPLELVTPNSRAYTTPLFCWWNTLRRDSLAAYSSNTSPEVSVLPSFIATTSIFA